MNIQPLKLSELFPLWYHAKTLTHMQVLLGAVLINVSEVHSTRHGFSLGLPSDKALGKHVMEYSGSCCYNVEAYLDTFSINIFSPK